MNKFHVYSENMNYVGSVNDGSEYDAMGAIVKLLSWGARLTGGYCFVESGIGVSVIEFSIEPQNEINISEVLNREERNSLLLTYYRKRGYSVMTKEEKELYYKYLNFKCSSIHCDDPKMKEVIALANKLGLSVGIEIDWISVDD